MTKQDKLIPGYGRYIINKKGIVRNKQTNALMKADEENSSRVKLVHDDGKRKWFYPKSVISDLFKKEVEEVKVDPYQKDTTNIVKPIPNVSNSTPKKYDFKTMDASEKRKVHASHKITKDDVIEIRRLLDGKLKTKKEIGEEYGIAPQTAGKIGNRVIYTSIPEVNQTT